MPVVIELRTDLYGVQWRASTDAAELRGDAQTADLCRFTLKSVRSAYHLSAPRDGTRLDKGKLTTISTTMRSTREARVLDCDR